MAIPPVPQRPRARSVASAEVIAVGESIDLPGVFLGGADLAAATTAATTAAPDGRHTPTGGLGICSSAADVIPAPPRRDIDKFRARPAILREDASQAGRP